MRSANKVVVNSVALYFNMLVTMGATLIGTRYLLRALGQTEYGIYVLVADIVAMFSFLNVSMAAATQRFLSYSIGEGKEDKLKEIFYNSVTIHIIIAMAIILIFLLFGVPAVKYWLDIPSEIRSDALFVLCCMAVSTFFVVVAVPYEGAMNAHEDIFVIAGINVFDALFKLSAAVTVYFISGNKLIIYASLIMLSAVMLFLLKRNYCKRHYREVHFSWHRINDFMLVKEMISFAGWNLVGTGCSLLRYQGAAIVINKFFGLVYNAAYGVAQQLNGFMLFFANSLVRPMRPLIVKNEGAGLHDKMVILANTLSKITFLMLCVIIIPMYLNISYILDIWLTDVPEGALYFCKGYMLVVLIGQISSGIQIAFESTGKIKRLQIVVGTMHALPLPVACLLFYLGYPAYTIMLCIVIEEVLALFLRLLIAKRDAGIIPLDYLKNVVLPCVFCACIVYITILQLDSIIILHPIYKIIIETFATMVMMALSGYFICFTAWEKCKVHDLISMAVKKIFFR